MTAPAILISRCLLGERCRYDGRVKPSILEKLKTLGIEEGAVRWIPICPEVDGGLSVPRPPSEIEPGGSASAVLAGCLKIRSNTGADVTAPYVSGARAALEAALRNGAELALLKARSPACSPKGIYDGTFSGQLVEGRGIAAQALGDAGLELFSEETLETFAQRLSARSGVPLRRPC